MTNICRVLILDNKRMYPIYSTYFSALGTGHNAQNSTNIISIFMKINTELLKRTGWINNRKLVLRCRKSIFLENWVSNQNTTKGFVIRVSKLLQVWREKRSFLKRAECLICCTHQKHWVKYILNWLSIKTHW